MVIYKTTNLINGKAYVGRDYYNNPAYFGSGLILQNAIRKYGKENFKKEILEHCRTTNHLNVREKFWIGYLKTVCRGIGYNIAEGGTGGNTFSNQPSHRKKEIRKRLSEAFYRMVSNPSEKYKNRGIKISQTKTGCKFSSRHRKNLSLSHKGLPAWNKGKTDVKSSEAKKLKIDEITTALIVKLYSKLPPRSISTVLRDMNILSVSDIVVRRILKEKQVYIFKDTRFHGGKNRITREEALAIAQSML